MGLAALALAGCQKVQSPAGVPAGEEAVVSVSVALPAISVRSAAAPGDGTLANRCVMLVQYSDDGTTWKDYYPSGEEQRTAEVQADLTADFGQIRLVTGHDYRLLFWADCADGTAAAFTDKYYSTAALKGSAPCVSIIASAFGANNDERDAFWGVHPIAKAELNGAVLVINQELTRPFGKLNIITSDWADVPAAMLPTHVNMSFTGVANTLNLATGEVSGSVAMAYSAPVAVLTASTGMAEDGHLSYDYLFASETQQNLASFTMEFLAGATATSYEVAAPFEFTNIPVRRNYETNVKGALLTDPANVTVVIKPAFATDSPIDSPVAE